MLWLLLLIVGVLTAGFAVPRIGKVIFRVFALLLGLVILIPLALVVTFQRARVRRRRRRAAIALEANEGSGDVDPGERPHLGRVIASP